MKKLIPAGKLLLAVVIILLLISKADFKNLLKSDLDNLMLVAAFGCIIVQNLLGALRWWSLLHGAGVKIPFLRALSITMQGIFWMMFLPG
ncbi:MAG: flippase-like domain-containing protein, partial [Lentisphaeria bacterium]|nr:flippase-like domain-containing protein [Lentisphaeria bacterium]